MEIESITPEELVEKFFSKPLSLQTRIKEIAVELAADFPNIENETPWMQLYAIEQGFKGTLAAIDDWNQVVAELRSRYNIPFEEVMEISKEILKVK